MKIVFDKCFDVGVDIVICIDNVGLYNVCLLFEYENLLIFDVINFE